MSYESIPAELIVRAGLLAAAEQFGSANSPDDYRALVADADSALLPVCPTSGGCCG
ncbi:MAG: hypothetical protein GX454_06040 [Brooklawnia sp.]|nr:hypothetical protein [Brooklawnia sp.]